ncbi:MAG: ArsR/SmtB family transcription factor [bacterium]
MDPKIKAVFEEKAKILKALSHPTRLFIIEELSRGKRCVYELTRMIGDDTSTVSKHLSVLKNKGIVQNERRGSKSFYQLRVPCILKFEECIDHILKANARDYLRLIL